LGQITMSHRSGSSPRGTIDKIFFMLQVMQQQFEQLNLVLGEVRDRIDQQEAAIRNLQGEDSRTNLFRKGGMMRIK
ncbi:unnamed protein product, partial [Ilex paraguariensis]